MVTDFGDQGPAGESPAMQAFLEKRRVDVLQRAIATLETCSDEELAAEAHRLAGTLGIFGFDEASVRLRVLMRTAQDDAATAAEVGIARADALDYLRGIRSSTEQKDPG